MQSVDENYTIVTKKSGDQYVSLCLELCVVACGSTKAQSIKSLQDAIESYLESLEGTKLSPTRPVPVKVLREFLRGEQLSQEPSKPVKAEVMMLAYA
jgi:predicted RNase H-like HicB family nuclease